MIEVCVVTDGTVTASAAAGSEEHTLSAVTWEKEKGAGGRERRGRAMAALMCKLDGTETNMIDHTTVVKKAHTCTSPSGTRAGNTNDAVMKTPLSSISGNASLHFMIRLKACVLVAAIGDVVWCAAVMFEPPYVATTIVRIYIGVSVTTILRVSIK